MPLPKRPLSKPPLPSPCPSLRPLRKQRPMPEAAATSPVNDSVKDEMPTMGFLEHLEELRKRIIYSIIAVAAGFFLCWGYAENIYQIMQRPIMDALQKNGLTAKLVYLNPTEPFNL